VTLRGLLDHTAGVPDIGLALYGQTQFETDQIPSQDTLARKLLADNKRWRRPDEEARYSNSHYLLLAAIVENASGRPFTDYVQEHLLTPLGLASTGYRYGADLPLMFGSHPADLTSFLAFFYVDKVRAVRAKKDGRYWFNRVYNASLGSTGLISNAEDTGVFMREMLRCLQTQPRTLAKASCDQIVESARRKVTKSPARGVTNLQQQLGWFVTSTARGEAFVHGGSGMGYTAMLQLFPEKDLGVFVVANDSYFDRQGGLAVGTAISRILW